VTIVCETCGTKFRHTGIRRPKRCPACKAAHRRAQDRARKGAYRECWQCGRNRPLTFDRDGPIEDDYQVPAAFCGVLCWVEWWDSYTLEELISWFEAGYPGAPRAQYPEAYQKIRRHADAGNTLPDYRGDPSPAHGGTAEDNELPYGDIDQAFSAFNQ